ncbi:unnamed protein product [Leptosia nina]|uniref:Chitin-binding type-2 domain-containing protein n=1 Tax=Leptosia nina TaxID=320188 RepID=A0AAV1JVG4_9NEOP
MWLWFLLGLGSVLTAEGAGAGAARLVCYVENARITDLRECTHLVYTGKIRDEKLDGVLEGYRSQNPKLKIIVRVTTEDKDYKTVLKSKYIQGLEVYNAHETFDRSKVSELVKAARSAISSASKGPLLLALPAHPELLAKYYDLRELVKVADLMMVQTHALGVVKKMTYHPSRLSGLWDMMNTDSVVDLIIGLGVPASKIVVSLPATVRRFSLQNETLSTPGSPTRDEEPREMDQSELCRTLQKGRWTLERDQDLSAPYAFQNLTWISFEDASSVDVKGKYARVRGLAGLALVDADRDEDTLCGFSLRRILHKVLNQQSRAPRAAVLRSLENEILSAGSAEGRVLDALQVSPYRITQVVDSDGVIHSIREDTRTEFSCSRQGYFVHPRSCARFYRCVKFDQYSPDFTVFEFDCPVGLAFDARYEVCVWPGSLPDTGTCPGTAEIAPVPATRFICPTEEGFYVDPENCRWFFACLDHGKSPLTAYEFRCPFGLGFDAARLRCDWPWLVPACGNIGRYEAEAFGLSTAALTGATGFQGRTANAVNIAAHQNLVSGAAVGNLVGVRNGFLDKHDALDANFIATQEVDDFRNYQLDYSNLGSQGESSGVSYKVVAADAINKGLVQATNYDDDKEYTSGSIILDDYRLPTGKKLSGNYNQASREAAATISANLQYDSGKYKGNDASSAASYSFRQVPSNLRSGAYRKDYRGAYVHNPIGDRAKPYQHIEVPPVPYEHLDINSKDYFNFDKGTYVGSHEQDSTKSNGYDYPKPGVQFHEGFESHPYTVNNEFLSQTQSSGTYRGSYGTGGIATYVTDDKVYPGAPHTLTAGAVNVGFVGKTTLVDDANRFTFEHHVPKPVVTVTHVGTDSGNLDGYGYLTTPASAIEVTTSSPITLRTTYEPQTPKTSVKQIFTQTQPAITYVEPKIVAVTPNVEVAGFNTIHNYENTYSNARTEAGEVESKGYSYARPSVSFEDGFTYSTTPAAVVVTKLRPKSFSHNRLTLHSHTGISESSTPVPVTEEPFKRIVAYTTGDGYVLPTSQSHSQQSIRKTYERPTPPAVTFVPVVETIQHTSKTPKVSHISNNLYKQFSTPVRVEAHIQHLTPEFDYSAGTSFVASSTERVTETTARTIYENPLLKYTVKATPETDQHLYTLQASPVSSYHTHFNSEKILHDNQRFGYDYSRPSVKFDETGIKVPFSESTEQPLSYSHESILRSSGNTNSGFYENPPTVSVQSPIIAFETSDIYLQPLIKTATSAAEPIRVSTERPKLYNQNTITQSTEGTSVILPHETQVHKENSQAYETGYEYSQPGVTFRESERDSIKAPVLVSVAGPQSHSQQTFHTVEKQTISSPIPSAELTYLKPAVTVFEEPRLNYSQPSTVIDVRPDEYAQISQSTQYVTGDYGDQKTQNNLDYSYDQPEIQRNVHISSIPTYSAANVVSHQYFSQTQRDTRPEKVFVSTTPSSLIYEDHYSEYEAPKQGQSFNSKHIASIPREYYSVSTTPTPLQEQKYNAEYGRESLAKLQHPEAPEIQVSYNAEEYIPPKEFVAIPAVSSTPRSYTNNPTRDYLPPDLQSQYHTPEYESSTKSDFFVTRTEKQDSLEYLPPAQKSLSHVISFDSFGYDAGKEASSANRKLVKQQQEYLDVTTEEYVLSSTAPLQRKPNIVVEKAKSNILGFGTVGPDAGLVSTYTTSQAPTTVEFLLSTTSKAVEITQPTRRTRPKYSRPTEKIVSATRAYESTTYQAPEYLPPSGTIPSELNKFDSLLLAKNNPYESRLPDGYKESSTSTPSYKRKQNIVVEIAKSNSFMLDTDVVTPSIDAVTVTPITSTSASHTRDFDEITSARLPIRRTRPKIAVVTKVNDFNPLLVRKLGAVCSCQSPVLVLKGRRPTAQTQTVADDSGEEDVPRGDVEETFRTVTTTPTVTPTLNPIIVPDDSFYQEYQEAPNDDIIVTPGRGRAENYVSSTPIVSTTKKLVKVRPGLKSVTAPPTHEAILLNRHVSPEISEIVETAKIDTQSFDRYGPGGWRSRDETLQGSIDCQRVGLFRHPKQCNKFYACRWDCTKQRFTLHVFNCPVQLSFDPNIGACNWPSQGPACQGDTLLANSL